MKTPRWKSNRGVEPEAARESKTDDGVNSLAVACREESGKWNEQTHENGNDNLVEGVAEVQSE